MTFGVCVCVHVRVQERERQRETEGLIKSPKEFISLSLGPSSKDFKATGSYSPKAARSRYD